MEDLDSVALTQHLLQNVMSCIPMEVKLGFNMARAF